MVRGRPRPRLERGGDPAGGEFGLQAGQIDPFPAEDAAVGVDLQVGQEVVLAIADEDRPGDALDPLAVNLAGNPDIRHAAHCRKAGRQTPPQFFAVPVPSAPASG